MQNKKTFKAILIFIAIYMLLSWVIVSGNFDGETFASNGFNQFGLFDFLFAPISLFNSFVVMVTKRIDGYVSQVAYGNTIIAIVAIAAFYGILNKTGAYQLLVDKVKNKFKKKKDLFLVIVSIIYFLVSSLTGLNLLLFLYFPFVSAVLGKLKYDKKVIFLATIGAMLFGQVGALFIPSINGMNRVLFQTSLTSNIISRIVLALILLIMLLATIYFKKDKKVKKSEKILLLDEDVKVSSKEVSIYPIVIVGIIVTLILSICMYNWYYMFNSITVTNAYDKITTYSIHNYSFMKNIFGIGEQFGYWTGFTMSALLILASLIISFLYKLKLENVFEGAKDGISKMIPTIVLCIMSLTLVVTSLYNSNSFLYSIINNLFSLFKSNQILGIFSSGFLHNFFINDYFALLSSLSSPIVSIFGYEKLNLSLLITQVSHGLVSLITPFNVFLIAGLSYLNISYSKWMKYIWKTFAGLLVICIVVLYITKLYT